jgi:hypothetical protein
MKSPHGWDQDEIQSDVVEFVSDPGGSANADFIGLGENAAIWMDGAAPLDQTEFLVD